jgi:teichuronic acid biosynthesis glycosyltransferase TuaC
MTTAPPTVFAAAESEDPQALRILCVIPGEAHGASMIFARRQAQSLVREGQQVDIFYLRSRTSLALLAKEWVRFRRRVQRFGPHLVHAHYGTVTALFTVLAAGAVPVVITYRGSDLNYVPTSGRLREWASHLMSQLAALGAARIVCVSRGLGRRLWWRRGRVAVLASGVDTELFHPADRQAARVRLGWPAQDAVVLFNAGRDPRNKRLDLAEAAVAGARRRLPQLRMKVLHGEVDPQKIPDWMNAADCLLVTSDSEGSPTIVQEAMATNLPIVSVDTGDVAERLAGVRNTRIVERSALALAEAIVELTAVPRRSDGRARTEEFSLRNIARQLARLYRDASGLRATDRRGEPSAASRED